MDANFPNRAAQDALAETIRVARIIARNTIARCGGVGLAAYLGAHTAVPLPVARPTSADRAKAGPLGLSNNDAATAERDNRRPMGRR